MKGWVREAMACCSKLLFSFSKKFTEKHRKMAAAVVTSHYLESDDNDHQHSQDQ